MKYAVLKVSNGSNSVVAEGYTDLNSAKVKFHQTCASLWNAPDVILGAVMVVDDSLRLVNGCHEIITHEAPTTETTEE